MTLESLLNRFDPTSRRDFMGHSAKALLGLTSMPLLTSAAVAQAAAQGPAGQDPASGPPLRPATARNVIYLYMSGGMSQLDTFDPKPGAATQGPTEVIGTNVDGIQVSSNFPNMARMMDRVAVLNSVATTQGAHAQGRYFMHTSYELRGTIRHPSMGAWLGRLGGKLNPTLPPHVAVGGDIYCASGGFFDSGLYPLPIGAPEDGLKNSKLPSTVSEETFHRRLSRVRQMDEAFAAKYDSKLVRAYAEMYDQAVKLMTSKDLEAFSLDAEPTALRDAYGRDEFGQGCLLARRLIEHGVRFVEVVSNGWDTHNDNFDAMDGKCPPLDRTLATLLADLEARGLLEETLVVLATEFGRTPDVTAGRNGRNHYPKAFTCLLAGGGIRGGQRYGATDQEGREIVDNRVMVADFNATIAYALGLSTDYVVTSPSGRPFQVANKGKPVTALFA